MSCIQNVSDSLTLMILSWRFHTLLRPGDRYLEIFVHGFFGIDQVDLKSKSVDYLLDPESYGHSEGDDL
jgi:hypothetical protein